MSNGINCELDFERRIGDMQDRQLLEFVARQTYEMSNRCIKHDKRITNLENNNRKQSGITGGISGTITGIIIGLISYFTSKS